MKTVAIALVLALAVVGVAAPLASADTPPGYMRCELQEEPVAQVYEPTTGLSYTLYGTELECYY